SARGALPGIQRPAAQVESALPSRADGRCARPRQERHARACPGGSGRNDLNPPRPLGHPTRPGADSRPRRAVRFPPPPRPLEVTAAFREITAPASRKKSRIRRWKSVKDNTREPATRYLVEVERLFRIEQSLALWLGDLRMRAARPLGDHA